MAVTGAEAQIVDALLNYVATVVGPGIGLSVSFPNVPFKRTSEAYLAVSVMPNTATETGIAFGSDIDHEGLLQISVFWPTGSRTGPGLVQPMMLAAQVVAAFARGTVISRNGIQVRIEQQPQVAPALTESDWVQIPTTCRWRAIAPDPTQES